jgi:hypothetical protein
LPVPAICADRFPAQALRNENASKATANRIAEIVIFIFSSQFSACISRFFNSCLVEYLSGCQKQMHLRKSTTPDRRGPEQDCHRWNREFPLVAVHLVLPSCVAASPFMNQDTARVVRLDFRPGSFCREKFSTSRTNPNTHVDSY